MAATPSKMVALGTRAPHFRLPDPSGKIYDLNDFKAAQALVVMFICNHCPFVKHIRDGLAAFGRDYRRDDVAIIAINSNDAAAYPDDRPEMMLKEAKQAGYTFPYLVDESQAVAKSYAAACTPDFFLFDAEQRLVYRGQFDDSRPGNDKPVDGKDLRAALDALLAGKPISSQQTASIGCNIKWKAA